MYVSSNYIILVSLLLFKAAAEDSVSSDLIKHSSHHTWSRTRRAVVLATYGRCGGIWCPLSLRTGSESRCRVRCGSGSPWSVSVWDPLGGAGPSHLCRSPSMTPRRCFPGCHTAWWRSCLSAHTGFWHLERDKGGDKVLVRYMGGLKQALAAEKGSKSVSGPLSSHLLREKMLWAETFLLILYLSNKMPTQSNEKWIIS